LDRLQESGTKLRTLSRKIRADSHLLILTPEQKDIVFTHCETVSLAEGVRWIGEQFGIATSKTALCRWLAHQRIARRPRKLDSLREDLHLAKLITQAARGASLTY